MSWHYSNEGKQVGPISETEFEASVKSGIINEGTLVWKEGLAQWTPYGELSQTGGVAVGTAARCAECGREHAQDEMVNFGGLWVCAECKPQYVQKIREGVPTGTSVTFWRSGKRLVMPINSTLPHRCVKCNAPTTDAQIKRKLYWHHPAIYLVIFVHVIIYVIVALCCRKRATTAVSLCSRHRTARRNIILLSWLLALGGLATFGISIAKGSGWGIFLGTIVLLGGMIHGVVRGRLVFANKIDKEHVWLGGCKPEFLAEFPEWTGPK